MTSQLEVWRKESTKMCAPKVIPGHKGMIVGDREDMIRRARLLSKSEAKLMYKRKWDPNSKSKITKAYDATTGKLYTPVRRGG